MVLDKLIIGCGYLGSRVASLWQAQGHRVFATTRKAARAEELRARGIVPILCDVLNPAQAKDLPAVDTALYCVGFDRAAGRLMREVYVTGLGNVLGTLAVPGRLLYVSSTGVYGQTAGEEVDEDAATEPVEEAGKIVLEAERLVRELAPQAVVLRFAGIYGPGRLMRRQAIEAGDPIVGDADKWLNLIHVEDGARAILAAEERARPGAVYNICDDCPVRRREFYGLLAKVLGAPEPRFVPADPGAPIQGHERNNRRIVNRRMHTELKLDLRFPSCDEGLAGAREQHRF